MFRFMNNVVVQSAKLNHLVQLRVRNGADPVAGEVEDLERALHRVQRLDGDLAQQVVRGLGSFSDEEMTSLKLKCDNLEYLEGRSLKELLRKRLDSVPAKGKMRKYN